MDDNKENEKLKKIGNWISTLLLGDTHELIVHIDERTMMMQKVLEDIKPKVDDMHLKVDVLWKKRISC